MAGVEAICPPRRYRRGDAIFLQGDPATGFFILVEGRVRLILPTAKGERTVALLGDGDIFGESFLTGKPMQATTASVQSPEAVVCPISREQFLEIARTLPEVALAFAALLAERIGQLTEEMAQGTLPAPVRVGRLLLSLGQRFGQKKGRGIRLDLGLSQEELATFCGVTRVTVAQAFHLFRAEGIMEKEGSGYLLYPDRMEKLLEAWESS
ncbi:Crp/Fnr family transcriptional regulator [Thermus neutrinimicus]|uniref:Crp/Fnr family transcriptional regulator n=1 Tax=Thermus neutrinimicus TaxID=2908149 RepID=UPI001FA946D8|nr:Crp/Fnr family transcriptional regulator [Thermus neutrinimicus]